MLCWLLYTTHVHVKAKPGGLSRVALPANRGPPTLHAQLLGRS